MEGPATLPVRCSSPMGKKSNGMLSFSSSLGIIHADPLFRLRPPAITLRPLVLLSFRKIVCLSVKRKKT